MSACSPNEHETGDYTNPSLSCFQTYRPRAKAPINDVTVITAAHKPQSDILAAPPVKLEGVGPPAGAVTDPLVVLYIGIVADAEAWLAAWADFVAKNSTAALVTAAPIPPTGAQRATLSFWISASPTSALRRNVLHQGGFGCCQPTP